MRQAGVGEGFLGLQAQTVARHHPTNAINDTSPDQPRGGNDRQQGFASAGCHRGKDVADVGRFTGGECRDNGCDLLLVASKGAGRGRQARGSAGFCGGTFECLGVYGNSHVFHDLSRLF